MAKFLILRFSSIGDIVLTTPVIRCLKQQIPHAEVHYFTKPGFKTILEHNPYIDHIHVLDKPLLTKLKELKQLGFDYIIDLHNNLRTRIIKGVLDVPAFSFNKLNTEKSITVNFKLNTLPDIHIVDRYLQTLADFGVVNDEEGLDYFFPPQLEQAFHLQQYINQPNFIAFAIGAQHATKRLPTPKIIDICSKLNAPIVLLGGKEDAENGDDIVKQSGKHVINLCGQLSLHQSALMVKHATKLITHDTGLMHIAAALKKETVSIWGNTIPEFGMSAYYGKYDVRSSIFEVQGLSCRPCSKIGYKACPKKHFNCMNLQDTHAISYAINQ